MDPASIVDALGYPAAEYAVLEVGTRARPKRVDTTVSLESRQSRIDDGAPRLTAVFQGSRLSAFYPLSTMFFHSRAHRSVIGASGISDGMKVLEVATGSGEMFRRLVRANPTGTTVGLDLSPNMAAYTLGLRGRNGEAKQALNVASGSLPNPRSVPATLAV